MGESRQHFQLFSVFFKTVNAEISIIKIAYLKMYFMILASKMPINTIFSLNQEMNWSCFWTLRIFSFFKILDFYPCAEVGRE